MRANLAQREPERESYRVSSRVDRYEYQDALASTRPC